ncbi:MAG TPA: excisionase family DNA-binding protein [Myxococcales bacterium]|jgi:excisionase family DNA binding protein
MSVEESIIAALVPAVRNAVREEMAARADAAGDGYLTILAGAAYLGITGDTLQRWTREGRVATYRPGGEGRPKVRRSDLDKFMAAGKLKLVSGASPTPEEAAAAALARIRR